MQRNELVSQFLQQYREYFNQANDMNLNYTEENVVDAVLSKLDKSNRMYAPRIEILQAERVKEIQGRVPKANLMTLSSIECEFRSIDEDNMS